MSQQSVFQGFLSVKVPSKMRGLLPWKTWKTQWISVRCQPSGGVDLIIGRNTQNVLHISPSDIIVRTQSRSHWYAFGVYPSQGSTANFCLAGKSESDTQKWIATLRKLLRPPLLPVEEYEFSVSIVDNTFTRSSGFPGLYGILRVNNSGITITDPSTSKVKAHWLWNHLSHFYIAHTYNKEDAGRICTIITSSEFRTGIGKIRIFCHDTIGIVREIMRWKCSKSMKFQTPKRCTPYRHNTFSEFGNKDGENGAGAWSHPPARRRPSVSDPVKMGRRLSKSEGNLLSLCDQLDTVSECSDSSFIHDFYNSLLSACFSDTEDKSSPEPDESHTFRKIAPSIISTGVDMIRISEVRPNDSTGNVYQEVETEIEDNELTSMLRRASPPRKLSPRRESGVSVASGVYEEIDELSASFRSALDTVDESSSYHDPPPPLPPRRDSFNRRLRSNTYQNASALLQLPDYQNKFISRSAGNTPLPSPPSLSRTPSSAEFLPNPWHRQEESHYVPMNPCSRHLLNFAKSMSFAKEAADDQIYVVMSSFKKDQT